MTSTANALQRYREQNTLDTALSRHPSTRRLLAARTPRAQSDADLPGGELHAPRRLYPAEWLAAGIAAGALVFAIALLLR